MASKMAPRSAQEAPRGLQEAPERPHKNTQTAHNWHRNVSQEASEPLPGGPRETYHEIRTNCPDASMRRSPRRLQDRFTSAPEPPKTVPKRPLDGPKTALEAANMVQDDPEMGPGAPKTLPRRPQAAPIGPEEAPRGFPKAPDKLKFCKNL